jgi:hypothetical protein
VARYSKSTTTFTKTDLAEIRITQSADVLYITHPDFPPQQLVRVSALSWTLSGSGVHRRPVRCETEHDDDDADAERIRDGPASR